MTSRKEFLLAGAFASFVPGNAIAAAATGTPAKPDEKIPKLVFDKAAFDAILASNAQHRQCFGATKLSSDPLQQMCNSMNAYDDFYGEHLHAVAVLYHGPAIALACNDALWNELLIPAIPFFEKQGVKISLKPKPGGGNPFLHASKGASKSGAAEFLKVSPRAAYAKITGSLVKGASLVPAGVMAIDAAQAAKFSYLQSTL